MDTQTFVFTIFLIFTGAAIFSTVSLFTRQSLLVSYILLGIVLGPFGFKMVSDISITAQIGEIGIIFLLFLLGLHLQPQNLIKMLSEVTAVGLISSVIFLAVGWTASYLSGFSPVECLVVGMTMMFSSTIIGLKLLPAKTLLRHHTGEVMISVLLFQDIIAIIILVVLNAIGHTDSNEFIIRDLIVVMLGLPFLLVLAFLAEQFILVKLFTRFKHSQEYAFLLSIGWCLGMAQLGQIFGLPGEIGAFIAGVALAASPIAIYIAENLRPLRDFFLILFFFSVGAGFDFQAWRFIILPTICLTALILLFKPMLYTFLLRVSGEKGKVSREAGLRLGQASEFSLLIASTALTGALISYDVAYLIQATTILTFIISSYLVSWRYPNDRNHVN